MNLEEAIKSLQGKTLSKNKLFDILANIDLNKKIIRCEACRRTFTVEASLKRHLGRNPSCVKWIALPQKENIELKTGIHLVINDILKDSISDGKLECKFCYSTFTNTGNLHKHFNVSHVCNRLAYQEFKKRFNSLSV